MIRLATGYAKLRLSKTIELRDCAAALELFMYCFYRIEIRSERIPDEFENLVNKIRDQIPNFKMNKKKMTKIIEEEPETKSVRKSVKKKSTQPKKLSANPKTRKKRGEKFNKVLSSKLLKFILKKIKESLRDNLDNVLTVKDMYKLVQESGNQDLGFITSQKILRKYILNLENENKLMLDEENKIYSLV
jgi:DNA replicative helicase MCM subunit Mcm2 (Cdc46/Mcm family)